MSIVKPFTFTAGTKARANEVNQDFDVLYTEVNNNASDIIRNANDIDNLESNKADKEGSVSNPFNVKDITTTSTTQAVNAQSMRKAITPLFNYISGLIISKDSNSPNDTILVQPGSCYDSTNSVVLSLSGITSKRNEEQGPSDTYYVYIIGNTEGTSTDILISELSSNPNMPEGYSKFRLIGSYDTDSDNNITNIIYYGYPVDINNSPSGIVGRIFPDYDNGISVAFPISGSEYTAPSDGWFVSHNAQLRNTAYLYINGVKSGFSNGAGGDATAVASIIVPLVAGDEVYWDRSPYTAAAGSATFYPIKGGS